MPCENPAWSIENSIVKICRGQSVWGKKFGEKSTRKHFPPKHVKNLHNVSLFIDPLQPCVYHVLLKAECRLTGTGENLNLFENFFC